MKTQLIAFSCLCLSLGVTELSVNAQVFGPNGGSASGNRIVRPNASGGTTHAGSGTVTPPSGASSTGGYRVRTNGQGDLMYGRSRTSTSPDGQTHSIQTTGSGSYNPETGYNGQGIRTVNGQTYSTTTNNGAVTVTDPSGNSKTWYRRR